jgi:glycosyltransferase involved in cell wall biosynthesis
MYKDGSTDNSGFILSHYASIDCVKVISQNNRGLSASRNIGLSHANRAFIFSNEQEKYSF